MLCRRVIRRTSALHRFFFLTIQLLPYLKLSQASTFQMQVSARVVQVFSLIYRPNAQRNCRRSYYILEYFYGSFNRNMLGQCYHAGTRSYGIRNVDRVQRTKPFGYSDLDKLAAKSNLLRNWLPFDSSWWLYYRTMVPYHARSEDQQSNFRARWNHDSSDGF